jgi:rod shape-determining protein MreD
MTGARVLVFYAVAYLALLAESAGGYVFRNLRNVCAAPELGLFVLVYLGVCGRGGAIWLTASALAVGYLQDLLIGSPRGVEALAFALVALFARALHGRVFLDRFGQLAIVCAGFALLHAALVMLLGDGPMLPSLRMLPSLVVSALWVGPIALRALRRLDQRVAPEARSLTMAGDLGGAWR